MTKLRTYEFLGNSNNVITIESSHIEDVSLTHDRLDVIFSGASAVEAIAEVGPQLAGQIEVLECHPIYQLFQSGEPPKSRITWRLGGPVGEKPVYLSTGVNFANKGDCA